jgi:hypothetical protein
LYIASLPLDLEIGYYHMMSAMAQLQRKHANESTNIKHEAHLERTNMETIVA